jgi:hypothetical protein
MNWSIATRRARSPPPPSLLFIPPEALLVDETTVETAPAPGTNIAFRTYEIELEDPSRLYVEVTGSADDNGDADDDDFLCGYARYRPFIPAKSTLISVGAPS